jgi:uncharacterized protein
MSAIIQARVGATVGSPPTAGWLRGVCAALVMFVLYVVFSITGALPAALLVPHSWGIVRGVLESAGVAVVAVLALIVGFEVLLANRRRDVRPYGFQRPRYVPSSLGLGVLLGFGALIAGNIITNLLGLTGTTTPDLHSKPQSVKMFFVFLAIVIAPWMEEVSIRGVMFSSLDSRFGFMVGAPVSGFLWAGGHFVPAVLFPFTFLGIVLAFVRRRTGSVLPGIGLHGTQNTLASLTTRAGGGWLVLPMALILVVTLVVAWWRLPAQPAGASP